MKKLSIIVPVYNVQEYVGQCLNSLIKQSYRNVEIIVVNDGSTDNSLKICLEYEKRDKRVKVYCKENGGLSDARNYGIKKACGDYITFVDSDDYVAPNIYVNMIHSLETENSQIVCCNSYMFYETHKKIKHNISKKVNHYTPYEAMKDVLTSGGNIDYAAWNKIYVSTIFEQIRFPFGKIYEDMHIMLSIFNMCEKITLLNEPLYYYRQRESSITKCDFSIKNLDIISAYESMINFLDSIKSPLESVAKDELLFAKILMLKDVLVTNNKTLIEEVYSYKKSISLIQLFKSNCLTKFRFFLIVILPKKLLKILISKN